MSIKISVVLPVYNVESFLRQCLHPSFPSASRAGLRFAFLQSFVDSGCMIAQGFGPVNEMDRLCKNLHTLCKNLHNLY